MANETRHAAWQTERLFAVRLLPEEGEPRELVDGLGDFLEAVDFAVDGSPARIRSERGPRASRSSRRAPTGWRRSGRTHRTHRRKSAPLMKIFGFDPVNWKAASSEYSPKEPALGPSSRVPRRAAAAAAAARVEPGRASPGSGPGTGVRAAAGRRRAAGARARPGRSSRQPAGRPAPPVPVAPPHRWSPRGSPRAGGALAHPAAAASRSCGRVARPGCPLVPDPRGHLALARRRLQRTEILAFVLLALSGLWWRRDKLIGKAKTDGEDWL